MLSVIMVVVQMGLAAAQASAIPDSYVSFMQKCDRGELDKNTCQSLQKAHDDYLTKCETPAKTQAECESDWDKNFKVMKMSLMIALLIGSLCVMCCGSLVPICGCLGAKQDSRGCTLCFVGWNGLAILGALYNLSHGLWTGLISVPLVIACCYYGYKLQDLQQHPRAQQQFLAAGPPVIAQYPQVQPLAPQAMAQPMAPEIS
jgi:hypothetical protein